MKKLYSFLAAAVVGLAATAATPALHHSGVSLNAADLETPLTAIDKSMAKPSRSAWKAAPARVSAAESLIDVADTSFVYACNYGLVTPQAEFYEFQSNQIRPVKGKENTYSFDFFQFFQDAELLPVEAELNPETGIFSADSKRVLASVEGTSGKLDLFLIPLELDSDGRFVIRDDMPLQFELGETCIFLDYLTGICVYNHATEELYVNMVIVDGAIGWFNAVAHDVMGLPRLDENGNPTIVEQERAYGFYVFPLSGKEVSFLNGFNCGYWEYEIVGDLDMKAGVIVFNDAVLYEANSSQGIVPITLVDGNGSPTVELDYSTSVSMLGVTGKGFELAPDYTVLADWNDYTQKQFRDVQMIPLVNIFDVMADAAEIESDDANAPVEFFNLQGVRVNNPENGVYIRRQGSNVQKVLVK